MASQPPQTSEAPDAPSGRPPPSHRGLRLPLDGLKGGNSDQVVVPLSNRAKSQMYTTAPISHREAAAAERGRLTPRWDPDEQSQGFKPGGRRVLQQLTSRHSTLTDKMTAATELANLALDDAKDAIADADGTLEALVKLARTGVSAQAKERAAGALRNLAVSSWKNKEMIAEAGGIPALVEIAKAAGSTEASIDFAVGALASLALDADNKRLIADAEGIPVLVALVSNGQSAAIQTLAATCLGNLCSNECRVEKGQSNKVLVREASGIVPLVDLATYGTTEQREAAVGALWNLAFNNDNKRAIADAGGIPPLVDLVRAGTPAQKEKAAGALANLTVEEDNRSRVLGAGGIAALVPVMTGGETERQRSFAHACLTNLAIDSAIRQKILLTVANSGEAERAKTLVEDCRTPRGLAVDDAKIEAELRKEGATLPGASATPDVSDAMAAASASTAAATTDADDDTFPTPLTDRKGGHDLTEENWAERPSRPRRSRARTRRPSTRPRSGWAC